MYKIIYAKSVKKDLKNIPTIDLLKIKSRIEKLQDFPNITNIKQLTSHSLADFRLRVGKYRILFDVDLKEEEISILKISHRKDAY